MQIHPHFPEPNQGLLLPNPNQKHNVKHNLDKFITLTTFKKALMV